MCSSSTKEGAFKAWSIFPNELLFSQFVVEEIDWFAQWPDLLLTPSFGIKWNADRPYRPTSGFDIIYSRVAEGEKIPAVRVRNLVESLQERRFRNEGVMFACPHVLLMHRNIYYACMNTEQVHTWGSGRSRKNYSPCMQKHCSEWSQETYIFNSSPEWKIKV